MQRTVELVCSPETAAGETELAKALASAASVPADSIQGFHIERKSIDARSKNIKVNISARLFIDEAPSARPAMPTTYGDVQKARRVLIIGCGPAGMFAALRLIELGFKPIILERGKDVQARRRDLKAINRDHIVNEDSNYCFGEGGAGTYSDGKLYTRSKKRGSVDRILHLLVQNGATEEILYEAHPHIGTNKLPKVVQAIRDRILSYGGEIHFNTRVVDFLLEGKKVKGVKTQDGESVEGDALILATGHSARDIFTLLHSKGVYIEAKPFAMGVRAEHPQSTINEIQYHGIAQSPYLPAASYKLVEQIDGRGVYSFCMCPGGFIVPSATAGKELVVNGMSPSKRDNTFANSGIVVAIEQEDLKAYKKYGPLAGMYYQAETEEAVWQAGGSTQSALAQRMTDFCKGKTSSDLNETSYVPGLSSGPLHSVLPAAIGQRLQKAFMKFGQKMPGYYTSEANLIGLESRTSSPVRIPRDKESLQHPQYENLFPCGEGAGFAGGIVSAAIDGENCAEAAVRFLKN